MHSSANIHEKTADTSKKTGLLECQCKKIAAKFLITNDKFIFESITKLQVRTKITSTKLFA